MIFARMPLAAMALPVLPNVSNFLAVALVINRPRAGPKLVFHYPPHVLPGEGRRGPKTEDEDELGDEDDAFLERLAQPSGPSVNPAELLQWNRDDHLITESGSQIVPWEHVAGFPTHDLESILTPGRAYHKRLFQVSLEPLVCVSYPIYVPENGVWKRKKKKLKRDEPATGTKTEGADATAQVDAEAPNQEEGPEVPEADHVEVKDMAAPPATNEDEVEKKKSSMTMFNLVFILKPEKHEVKELVDIMFANIIKKVNKAYKYCQQRGEFVWKESKKILALKDKGKEDSRSPLFPSTCRMTDTSRAQNDNPMERDSGVILVGRFDAGHLRRHIAEQDRRPPAGSSRRDSNTLGADTTAVPCAGHPARERHGCTGAVAHHGQRLPRYRRGCRRGGVPGPELCAALDGGREENSGRTAGRSR